MKKSSTIRMTVREEERILVKEFIQGLAVGFLLGFIVAWLMLGG